jgi:ATP-dependent Zn protease
MQGFSGAQIENFVNQAAIEAVRKGHSILREEFLEKT